MVFVSAFLWAPSRDGLQIVYALSVFLPMLIILFSRKFNFQKYGGWPTIVALAYAGFSALSALWGEPKDFGFFILQWLVLATWLCGSSLIFSDYDIDVEKYISWLAILGALITIISIIHYYYFVFGIFSVNKRLWGWNVFRNANEIGAMCGIISLLAFTIAVQSLSLLRTWLFYLLSLIAAVGLVASFSRGAMLAFMIMILVTTITVRPPLKVWLPPLILIAVTVFIIAGNTNVFTQYATGRELGLGSRSEIWKEVFNHCLENIWLGVGMAKDTTISFLKTGEINHAHNAWLDTLYRTGVIGLALLLLHLGIVFKRISTSPKLLPLYMWLGFGCVYNLFDGRCFFWEIGAKWFLYWVPIGLITAIHTRISLRDKKQGKMISNSSLEYC